VDGEAFGTSAFGLEHLLRLLVVETQMRELSLPKSLCLAEVSRHSCYTDAAWNCPNNWLTGSQGV